MLHKRKCPDCNKELEYTHKSSYDTAREKNSSCRECSQNKRFSDPKEREKYMGKNNSFFGKKHSQESIDNRIKHTDYSFTQSKDYKEKVTSRGKKNGMYRKSFYDIWLKKYGKEIADEKLTEFKEKQSLNNSGKNNNMFGKPSPQGSGNGWSGWYKGWHFRSLLELSYMINVIERFNLKWEGAERIMIKYKNWQGEERNYFPDFLIEGKYLVEIKPKYLHNSVNTLTKKIGALIFCKDNNFSYKIRDTVRITREEFMKLYDKKEIKLTKYYTKKLKIWQEELCS
jgi:hypothetical protein